MRDRFSKPPWGQSDTTARAEAEELEARAGEAHAEVQEERARQEAALRASAMEEEEALEARARRREEATIRYEQEELRARGEASRLAIGERMSYEPLFAFSHLR